MKIITNMKKHQYIVLALAAVTLAGCNFFDSESPSAMDAATVYANENSTEQVIAGVYEQFGQDKSYRNRLACGYQGMNTDVEHGTKNSGQAEGPVGLSQFGYRALQQHHRGNRAVR